MARRRSTEGVGRLYARCHHEHAAFAHVLKKCDFAREGVLSWLCRVSGLVAGAPQDVL
jgi:RimJ/RimL family protein N-acetyltransferase